MYFTLIQMEIKRIRVGLVSENSADATKLKAEYPVTYVTYARNVLELHQQSGQNKLDAIIFLNFPNIQNDFFSFHQFLRGKKDFQNLPVAILTTSPLVFSKPINDPLIRHFQTDGNLFMALLNFFNSLQSNGALSQLVTQEQIEEDFTNALGQKLGKDTAFLSRAATADEAHESFICQQSDEICTNLIWIKFSVRILESGSESLKNMFSDSSESELQEYIERLLSLAFGEFNQKFEQNLKELGAVRFVNSDTMDIKERVPFIKTAKSFPMIFDSSICSILMEVSRYI